MSWNSQLLALVIVGGGAAIVAGLLLSRRRKGAKKVERKPGVVYLFQPARPIASFGPNLSPFCVKLETFLRMAKIPYESVKARSGPKGKLPYIELDGEVFADSGFIIRFLKKRFNVQMDDDLPDEQLAIAHATIRMLEENTYWTGVYRRWIEVPHLIPDQARENPPWWIKYLIKYFSRKVAKDLYSQGTGRHTPDEIMQIAESDLRAASEILGSKTFLVGKQPSSADASMFGMLSNYMWALPGSVHENLIKTELTNLHVYCWRMRRLYWPDWEELKTKKRS